MKANELMIGDWVNKMESDHFVKVRVIGLYNDTIDFSRGIIRGTITENGVEPIKLTREIAEKNGVKAYGKTEKFFIRVMYNKIPIKYVHELQHVLRLCGIEKEIEL